MLEISKQEKINEYKVDLFGANYLEEVDDGYYIPEALDDVIIEALTDEQYSILQNIAVAIDNFNDASTDKWLRGLRLLLTTLSWVKFEQMISGKYGRFDLAILKTCSQLERNVVPLEGLFMSLPELEKENDTLVDFINKKLAE